MDLPALLRQQPLVDRCIVARAPRVANDSALLDGLTDAYVAPSARRPARRRCFREYQVVEPGRFTTLL